MNARRFLSTSAVATAAVLLSIGVQTLAYSAPTSAPTTVDADAPLHVGSAGQTKTGALTVNGLVSAAGGLQGTTISVTGNISSQGKVTADTGTGEGFCLGTSCITAWPNTTGFVSTDATAQTKTGNLTVNGRLVAGDSTGYTLSSAIKMAVVGTLRVIDGTQASNKVFTSDSNGAGSWKDPVADLGLQKAVQGSGCTSGSSIISINPTTGVVTCGKVIKFGTRDGKGAVSVSMPDSSYAVLLDVGGGSTDCRASYATSKSTTGFTISAGDSCGAGTPYTWVAMDY